MLDIASQPGRLFSLLKDLPDGLLVVDSQWRCEFANAAAERMLGRSSESFVESDLRPFLGFDPTELADARVQLAGRDVRVRVIAHSDGSRSIYLQEIPRRVQLFGNAMPYIVWALAPDGSLLFLNRRWYEYTGTLPGPLAETSLEEFLHPEDAPVARHCAAKAISGGIPQECECRIRNSLAEHRWHLLQISPVLPDPGQEERMPGLWIGTALDIEDRKQAEDDLRRTRYQVLDALDRITDAFVSVEGNWRITYVNEEIVKRAGRPRERIVGRNLWDVFPEAISTPYFDNYTKVMKERTARRFELLYPPSGRWLEVYAHPTEDGFSAYVVDITDRKLAQQALQHSEERYRSLVNATSAVVWTTDAKGEFLGEQVSWQKFTGQTPQDYRHYGGFEAVHPDDRPFVVSAWQRAIQEKTEFSVEQRVWHQSSQRYRYTLSRAAPVLQADGTVREWVGTLTDIHDRKGAQKALEESERRYVMLANVAPNLVWTADPEGAVDYCNTQWLSYTGLPEPAVTTKLALTNHLHPDDVEEVTRGWSASVGTGETFEQEARIRRHDGQYRWFLVRAVPFRDENGQVVKWFGTSSDIDDQRRAAEELRIAHATLRTLILACPLPIVAFSVGGQITLWNPAAEKTFGWTEAEVLGRELPFIPPENLAEHREMRARDLAGDCFTAVEVCRTRKDGTPIDLSVSTAALRDEQGAVTGIMSLYIDITEKKRTGAALLESEARYRFLAEAMPQIVWTATEEGVIDYCNEHWVRYTGIPLEELSRKGWISAVHPDDQPAALLAAEKARIEGGDFYAEYRLRRAADGTYRWHAAHARLHQHTSWERKWLGTCVDIDDRTLAAQAVKQTNLSLRMANESLKQFSYAAAHDLQEPLRMVSLYSQLLNNRYQSAFDGDARRFLTILSESALRMQNLVADLLALTQLGDDQEQTPVAVDCNEILDSVCRNLAAQMDESQAEITVKGRLPIICAHPSPILQLFQNLISNALKYRSKEPPRIEVGVIRTQEGWQFHIKDNGIGISPAYHNRIFGVFKRLHREQYPGTGIGLAICVRVVERYCGRIWLESEEGAGSTFYFTLPGSA